MEKKDTSILRSQISFSRTHGFLLGNDAIVVEDGTGSTTIQGPGVEHLFNLVEILVKEKTSFEYNSRYFSEKISDALKDLLYALHKLGAVHPDMVKNRSTTIGAISTREKAGSWLDAAGNFLGGLSTRPSEDEQFIKKIEEISDRYLYSMFMRIDSETGDSEQSTEIYNYVHLFGNGKNFVACKATEDAIENVCGSCIEILLEMAAEPTKGAASAEYSTARAYYLAALGSEILHQPGRIDTLIPQYWRVSQTLDSTRITLDTKLLACVNCRDKVKSWSGSSGSGRQHFWPRLDIDSLSVEECRTIGIDVIVEKTGDDDRGANWYFRTADASIAIGPYPNTESFLQIPQRLHFDALSLLAFEATSIERGVPILSFGVNANDSILRSDLVPTLFEAIEVSDSYKVSQVLDNRNMETETDPPISLDATEEYVAFGLPMRTIRLGV